jgi:hypothetical protein
MVVFGQGEWRNYKLDVAELYAELGSIVDDPDLTNANENILRSALLGAYRIAVIVHTPPDTSWWTADLPIQVVLRFFRGNIMLYPFVLR